MGVPGLFAWLRKRYPGVASNVHQRSDGTYVGLKDVHNLYIDVNHVLHACAHASVEKGRDRLTNDQIFQRVSAYLDAVLDVVRPTRLLVVAIDGVAPRAKMAQQRTRRFLSAFVQGVTDAVEREVRGEMCSEAGGALEVPHITRFDANIITPGTAFMTSVSDFLKAELRRKVSRDPRFAGLRVLLSDASEPAEGEHKVMRLIRSMRAHPGYDPTTRHCVYGQDADLLLLALLSHEPNFIVLREASEPQGPRKPEDASTPGQRRREAPQGLVAQATGRGLFPNTLAGAVPSFEQVDIGMLRDFLQWEFEEFVGPPAGNEEGDEPSGSVAGAVWGAGGASTQGFHVLAPGATTPHGHLLGDASGTAGAAHASPAAAAAAAALARSAGGVAAGTDAAAATPTPGREGAATVAGVAGGQAAGEGGGEDGEEVDELTALLMGEELAVAVGSSVPPAEAATTATPSADTSTDGVKVNTASDATAAAAADSNSPCPCHRGWWPLAPEHASVPPDPRGVKPPLPALTPTQQMLQATVPRPASGTAAISFERVLDDLVLLTFLAGNDFLPAVPSIDIYDYPSGLDLVFTVYKALLPQLGSGITQPGGEVNFARLQIVLSRLSRDEEAAYARRAAHRRKRQEQAQAQDAAATAAAWAAFESLTLGGTGWVSMGEMPAGIELDELLAALPTEVSAGLMGWGDTGGGPHIDLRTASEEQVRVEFVRRVSKRVQDRVANPEQWAADPVNMGAAGYRQRHYVQRFKAGSGATVGGGRGRGAGGGADLAADVERVAKAAARAYLDGMAWVYRYYAIGPATIQFVDGDGQEDEDEEVEGGVDGSTRSEKGKASRRSEANGGPAAVLPHGASWTWQFPYHYAPLMCDLSNSSASAYRPSPARTAALYSPPLRIVRVLHSPLSAPVRAWAPPGGPVRPLLQLMSVLPPRSAAEALPSQLAHMLVVAHNIEDEEEEDGDAAPLDFEVNESGREGPRQGGASGVLGSELGPARRGQETGGAGGSRFLALDGSEGEEGEVEREGHARLGADTLNGHSSASVAGGRAAAAPSPTYEYRGYDEVGEEGPAGEQVAAGDWWDADNPWAMLGVVEEGEGAGRGEGRGDAGGGDDTLLVLAKRIARWFPSDISRLVDFAGKKWMHTGVVRLPAVEPPVLAQVLLEAAAAGARLSGEEQARNAFGPAQLLVGAPVATAARDTLRILAAEPPPVDWSRVPSSASSTASSSTIAGGSTVGSSAPLPDASKAPGGHHALPLIRTSGIPASTLPASPLVSLATPLVAGLAASASPSLPSASAPLIAATCLTSLAAPADVQVRGISPVPASAQPHTQGLPPSLAFALGVHVSAAQTEPLPVAPVATHPTCSVPLPSAAGTQDHSPSVGGVKGPQVQDATVGPIRLTPDLQAPWHTCTITGHPQQHTPTGATAPNIRPDPSPPTSVLDAAVDASVAWLLILGKGSSSTGGSTVQVGSTGSALAATNSLAAFQAGLPLLSMLAAQQEAEACAVLLIDLAALPTPPADACRVLPGALHKRHAHVTEREWRNVQAKLARNQDYTNRVLGFASSTSTSSTAPREGRRGRGGGRAGPFRRGGYQDGSGRGTSGGGTARGSSSSQSQGPHWRWGQGAQGGGGRSGGQGEGGGRRVGSGRPAGGRGGYTPGAVLPWGNY